MIEELGVKHLPAAVDLHATILHWSINARLGRDHLESVYDVLLHDESTRGFVDVAEDGSLLALIIVTTDHKSTREKIRQIYTPGIKIKLVFQSLFKPADFLDLAENLFLIPKALDKSGYDAEVLLWLSDTNQLRGRIAGSRLMKLALESLADMSALPAIAQVAKYDPSPNKYHESAGNRLKRSFCRNNIYVLGDKHD